MSSGCEFPIVASRTSEAIHLHVPPAIQTISFRIASVAAMQLRAAQDLRSWLPLCDCNISQGRLTFPTAYRPRLLSFILPSSWKMDLSDATIAEARSASTSRCIRQRATIRGLARNENR